MTISAFWDDGAVPSGSPALDHDTWFSVQLAKQGDVQETESSPPPVLFSR